MAQNNDSSMKGIRLNNSVIPKSEPITMNATSECTLEITEPRKSDNSQLPKQPIEHDWYDALDYEPDESDDSENLATPPNSLQSSANHVLKSTATLGENNHAAPNNNEQPSLNREFKSVDAPIDNHRISQPNQSMLLENAPNKYHGNFTTKISNTPSDRESRFTALSLPSQANQNMFWKTFVADTSFDKIFPSVPENHQKQAGFSTRISTNSANIPAASVVPQIQAYSWNHAYPAAMPLVLFKWPCFKFLNAQACISTCRYNHALPPTEEILPRILYFEDDQISYIYSKFVVQHRITFITYFEMMCEAFGMRKMKSELMHVITDCEKWSKSSFFKFIFDGLIKSGLSKRDAVMRMIQNCNQNVANYTTLIQIMTDIDAPYFMDLIRSLRSVT